MRIDSHQHYWEPRRGDYDWMPKDNSILNRRYGPTDLGPSLRRTGIDRTVVVQAAESVHETEYMLGLADASESVAAVVGWVNFEDPGDRRAARAPRPASQARRSASAHPGYPGRGLDAARRRAMGV